MQGDEGAARVGLRGDAQVYPLVRVGEGEGRVEEQEKRGFHGDSGGLFVLLCGEDAQDLFVARLDGGGEFLDFPCVRARMGEDEVDVVAVEGVVHRDVFRAARGEGDVAQDAVVAKGDGGDVVVGEDEVAGVVEEGDFLFLFARDAAQAEEVAVGVLPVQAGVFARAVFFAVLVDERLASSSW